MACYHPLRAYRPPADAASRQLIFSKLELVHLTPLKVSCGQCIGCRLEKSLQWAIRCVHEGSLYERNCFITLTYDEQHLPENGTLVKADFQKFMKRLRKRYGAGVRYFMCGEYGEKGGRPHYHAILFNFEFSDLEVARIERGIPLYKSASLSRLWPQGISRVGKLTFESAAYVARYCLKKETGPKSDGHYGAREWKLVRTARGRQKWAACSWYRLPEYTCMSRGHAGRGRRGLGGIGRPWLERNMGDVYPHDRVVMLKDDGFRIHRPPKYYDSIFEVVNPQVLEEIKFQRYLNRNVDDSTPERLAVKEKHQFLRSMKLKRGYESGESIRDFRRCG